MDRPFDVALLAPEASRSMRRVLATTFGLYCDFAGSFDTACEPETLVHWRVHLAAQGNLSANTINQMAGHILRLMQAAGRRGYISRNTATAFEDVLRSSETKEKPQRILAQATQEHLYALCNMPDRSSPIGLMYHALFLTLVCSGISVSQVVKLQKNQIKRHFQQDKSRYTIHIRFANSTRTADLSIEAFEAIDEWLLVRDGLGIESDYIFTGFARDGHPHVKQVSDKVVWGRIYRYGRKLGVALDGADFRRLAYRERLEAGPDGEPTENLFG